MRQFIVLTTVALTITPVARGQTINFSDVIVPTPPGYVNGSAGPGGNTTFTSGGATFNNSYFTSTFGDYWAGWAVGNTTQVTGYSSDFAAQYSAYNLPNGGGDGSPNYGLGYVDTFDPVTPTITLPAGTKPQSARITNTTYTAMFMLDGDSFGGPYSAANQDYLLLTIEGFNALDALTGTVNFYLANYNVPQPFVVSQWTTVDLTPLGDATSLQFTLSSVDMGASTPYYFALGGLVVTPVPEPATLMLVAAGGIGLAVRRRYAACIARRRRT